MSANSIGEYRLRAERPDEPRYLLLLDGFPAFREAYEAVSGRSEWYSAFQQLLNDGRARGIHVVLTADRPGSVPGSVASSVSRRVVLRMAEDTMYTLLSVDDEILTTNSPPGRAIIDDSEVQVAILGGASGMAEQTAAVSALAQAVRGAGRGDAPAIGSLPTEFDASSLPDSPDGLAVLGISEVDLGPISFEPSGVLLVGGGPGSGRTNALTALVEAIDRALDRPQFFYIGNRRSRLHDRPEWDRVATSPDEIAELSKELTQDLVSIDAGRAVVVIEGASDLVSTPADGPVTQLIRALKRTDHLVIAESETSTWATSWPLLNEVKSARRGVLLQPDAIEGDTILRTTFPRVRRSEFPPGRGFFVQAGKVVRVQLPLTK